MLALLLAFRVTFIRSFSIGGTYWKHSSKSIRIGEIRVRKSIMAFTSASDFGQKAREMGGFRKTPLVDASNFWRSWNPELFESGVKVRFKMECLQASGSFKDRGISNMIFSLNRRHPVKKLVCSSGGNAGHSVATVGQRLGAVVDVYVPNTTKPMMIEKIKSCGANVFVSGDNWNAADKLARMAFSNGGEGTEYIPPYDDPLIWEGNSSIVDELVEAGIEPEGLLIVLSVGGGGLLSGIQMGLDRVGWNNARILAVETEGAGSYAAAHACGKVTHLDKIDTVATSLGALAVTSSVLDNKMASQTSSMLVSDEDAIEACVNFAQNERILVEPACGAALASISPQKLQHILACEPQVKEIVVVVCGGSIVNVPMMQQWNLELLGRKQKLVY
jgi:L-serine/L-threonine ammonia-lyase